MGLGGWEVEAVVDEGAAWKSLKSSSTNDP